MEIFQTTTLAAFFGERKAMSPPHTLRTPEEDGPYKVREFDWYFQPVEFNNYILTEYRSIRFHGTRKTDGLLITSIVNTKASAMSGSTKNFTSPRPIQRPIPVHGNRRSQGGIVDGMRRNRVYVCLFDENL